MAVELVQQVSPALGLGDEDHRKGFFVAQTAIF